MTPHVIIYSSSFMSVSSVKEYSCHAYHEQLSGGKAAATLRINPAQCTFTVNNQTISMPLAGCELELGGAGDRILFFRHPNVLGWTFYSSDKQLLRDPVLKAHPIMQQQLGKLRRKRLTFLTIVAVVVAMLIATPIILFSQLGWISGKIAKQVPVTWEQQLGESAIGQYANNERTLDQAQSDELLQPLVAPLLSQLPDSPYDYQVYILRDATPNAMALPGGFIVINSGLILEAETAEELLGVVAHEIVHVEQQHGVRSVINTLGIYTLISALVGDVNGILAILVDAGPVLLRQSYSRQFEREADIQGYELMVQANIDPRGLPQFFEKLLALEQGDKTSGDSEDSESQEDNSALQTTIGFLSSHPDTRERIAYLNELVEGHNGEYRNLSDEFNTLQQAVEDFVVKQD